MDLKSSRWAASARHSNSTRSGKFSTNNTSRPAISSTLAPPSVASHNSDAPTTLSRSTPIRAAASEDGRADEFNSHRRLLRRLRWKLPALAVSHRLATSVDPLHPHYASCSHDSAALEAARREAELMFKVDWFEYYALLERALLHLLGVWGIRVRRFGPADPSAAVNEPKMQPTATETTSIIGQHVHAGPAAHRFHANVLASLDLPSNPLHAALGTGEARRQLGAAKQLRNLWKDADVVDSHETDERDRKRDVLSGYDMEQMLRAIFEGFDTAFILAERALQDEPDDHVVAMEIELDSHDVSNGTSKRHDDEDDLVMVDAMDWDEIKA